MPDEEKVAWATLGSFGLGMLAFAALVVVRLLGGIPVSEQSYSIPILICMMVMTVPVMVMRAILSRGSGDTDLGHDERDREITRRSDQSRYRVLLLACVVVLSMTFSGTEHFWIASVVFAGLGLSYLVGAAVQISGYRRGVAVR
ncbi:hypothetical protein ACIPVK_04195 [Paeniglutamicibacter sp. MACA_103]|uniref:hypothetical protein n=1 Tax=Paeniglutamicibacter sp. MACA_103 TaxID=3377337 RepID=UPI0038932FD0